MKIFLNDDGISGSFFDEKQMKNDVFSNKKLPESQNPPAGRKGAQTVTATTQQNSNETGAKSGARRYARSNQKS